MRHIPQSTGGTRRVLCNVRALRQNNGRSSTVVEKGRRSNVVKYRLSHVIVTRAPIGNIHTRFRWNSTQHAQTPSLRTITSDPRSTYSPNAIMLGCKVQVRVAEPVPMYWPRTSVI